MALKKTQSAVIPDLDQSIQIALDAAEASMDVTAEFERISAQFGETSKAAQRLEKMSRIGLIVASGIAIVAVLIMGFIWQSSSSSLNRLTATNTELLEILAQNISNMDQTLAPVLTLDSQMSQLREDFIVLSEAPNSIDSIVVLQAEIATMGEVLARSEAVQLELGDRIATLNGELAMNVSTTMQDTLAAQSEAYATLAANLAIAIETTGSTANTEDFAKIQEQMDARVAALDELINTARTPSPPPSTPLSRPRTPPQQEPDIIKFP
ncbi:hypothetical protein OAN307_c29460 [Octadecabacter antarcticus 307]|uniref:Uncharacterized protein n=1 Tax=Octadecabacter antarcticus 307 TaxID=391626 RepID=M9RDP2_9RHOB|nr:hypothetical protein [Octadecabacter antarcticus]AGI68496.1 hypothetical protein OAN307_c29460 [Octadecabacter antarcticus 307]